MNKLKQISAAFFSILIILSTSSCSHSTESNDIIISKWGDTNRNLSLLFFTKIDTDKNVYPSKVDVLQVSFVISEFIECVKEQLKNEALIQELKKTGNENHVFNVLNYADKVRFILEFMGTPESNLTTQQKAAYYDVLMRYLYRIQDEIIRLEYNSSNTFKKSVYYHAIQSSILVLLIFILITILLAKTLHLSRKKDITIQESKDSINHMLKVQEQERDRLARDLHDTVAQDLRYVISMTSKLQETEETKLILELQKQCINEIRRICYNMLPPDMENNDIVYSLQALCQSFHEKNSIDTRLTVTNDVDFSSFSSENLLHIYRITQEALANIQKHSEASEVTVLFRVQENKTAQNQKEKKLVMIISDDGKGIKKRLLSKINKPDIGSCIKGHFGVRNIKERVHLLNGSIKYSSFPECGTEIKIELPLN